MIDFKTHTGCEDPVNCLRFETVKPYTEPWTIQVEFAVKSPKHVQTVANELRVRSTCYFRCLRTPYLLPSVTRT